MKHIASVLVIATIMAAQYTSAAVSLRAKREAADDDGTKGGLLSTIESLPIVGTLVQRIIDGMSRLANAILDLLNSSIGRILGGALPCIFSTDAMYCTGITSENNVDSLMEKLMDALSVPEVPKELIHRFLESVVEPLLNTILGGTLEDSDS